VKIPVAGIRKTFAQHFLDFPCSRGWPGPSYLHFVNTRCAFCAVIGNMTEANFYLRYDEILELGDPVKNREDEGSLFVRRRPGVKVIKILWL